MPSNPPRIDMMPTVEYYQRQSLFFRLPREIRDQIYECYAYEYSGYRYDFESSSFHHEIPCASKEIVEIVRLELKKTCRIAADEMEGVAIRVNDLIFVPGSSEGVEDYRGLYSKAGRFRCLLKYLQETKMQLVLHVADLITPAMCRQLHKRYPTVSHCFGEPLRDAPRAVGPPQQREWQWRITPGRHLLGDDQDTRLTSTFDAALTYVLEMARARNPVEFDKLASRAFGYNTPDRDHTEVPGDRAWRYFFVEGSLQSILSWQPKPWLLPRDADLESMEKLLTTPKSKEDIKLWIVLQPEWWSFCRELDLTENSKNTKWYFSAAVIFIDFFTRLPKEHRRKIQHVTLREDRKSVSNPESHARGLIPFFEENNKLCIERHISLTTNLLPLGWYGIDNRKGGNVHGHYSGQMVLRAFIPWLEEVSILPALQLPKGAYTLVVEARSAEGIRAWEIIKRAASMQDAMTESFRRAEIPLPSLLHDEYFWTDDPPLPCQLPSYFLDTVREVIRGESIMRIDGFVGELWNIEELVRERQGWTIQQWRQEWQDGVLKARYPTNVFRDLRSRYAIPRVEVIPTQNPWAFPAY